MFYKIWTRKHRIHSHLGTNILNFWTEKKRPLIIGQKIAKTTQIVCTINLLFGRMFINPLSLQFPQIVISAIVPFIFYKLLQGVVKHSFLSELFQILRKDGMFPIFISFSSECYWGAPSDSRPPGKQASDQTKEIFYWEMLLKRIFYQ